jgi:hypothetical protein
MAVLGWFRPFAQMARIPAKSVKVTLQFRRKQSPVARAKSFEAVGPMRMPVFLAVRPLCSSCGNRDLRFACPIAGVGNDGLTGALRRASCSKHAKTIGNTHEFRRLGTLLKEHY